MSHKYSSVWDAISEGPEEAENMKLRSELMICIREHIKARQISSKAAQEMLGLSQPRLSYLMTGRIDKFSLDALVMMASRSGLHVSLRVGHVA